MLLRCNDVSGFWRPARLFAAVALSCGMASVAGCTEGPGPDLCASAVADEHSPSKGAAGVVVVVDRTAMSRSDTSTPPGLIEEVAEVQTKGIDSKKGSGLQVESVTAANEYPWFSHPLSLDLGPGDTSTNAENVRKGLLQKCVPPFIAEAKPPSKTENTDLVGALIAAKQQMPEKIIVLSGGLNTTPGADLRSIVDPAATANEIRASHPEFSPWTVPVVWFNLGEPSQPLSDQDRDRLIKFWQTLLGKSLNNDPREGGSQPTTKPTP